MIEFKNISKKYGQLQVLDKVDLTFESGTCVIFIGPNGCGKTTLIKCMLHMVMPDTGRMFIDGKEVSIHPDSRENVGFMPQIGRFPEQMTVKEVIEAVQVLRNYQGAMDMELYDEYRIDEFKEKKMNTLSGGTVQKVSAVIAFMFNPEIVVMDEPFAGLDIIAADILKRKIVREKQKGHTIFLTSHILSDIDDIITHVVFMDTGKIIFHKSIDELLKETGKENVNDAVMQIIR